MTSPDRPDDSDSRPGPSGVIRADYDWATTRPGAAVVETVAIAADREPTTIEPLFDVVDPDALDALVGSSEGDPVGAGLTVSFEFAGQSVTVHAGGSVVVRPVEP